MIRRPPRSTLSSSSAASDVYKRQLVIGTHTSDNEDNFLMVLDCELPSEDAEIDAREYEDAPGKTTGGFGGKGFKITISKRLGHNGEVNRARHCPQFPNLIATKAVSGIVNVFDLDKHEANPASTKPATPEMELVGHTKEGYGISWNRNKPGHVLSGADDQIICLWDVTNGSGEVKTLSTFTGHTDVVEDVDWHNFNESIFGSVGDDKQLRIWDHRKGNEAVHCIAAHSAEINSISFNPNNEYTLLTGSADKLISLWDMRNMSKALHEFHSHSQEVVQVEWSRHNESVFASCGADRRTHIWDLSKVGEEQAPEDAEDGPPELLFIHGGHTSKISDLAWNPNAGDEWVIASAAEDNILQIWQCAENIYDDDDEQPENADLE
eukprot:TRINITY_DN3004_c0_g2_i14.p1 TRINITY_DN3004_c0_g2~~TRINITY_DN3004_c0_g2_i14.p1  ORF type:complete len:380 (+),score=118.76 TRINITY_DN3004_c0_g2_i14:91-1230(+)